MKEYKLIRINGHLVKDKGCCAMCIKCGATVKVSRPVSDLVSLNHPNLKNFVAPTAWIKFRSFPCRPK